MPELETFKPRRIITRGEISRIVTMGKDGCIDAASLESSFQTGHFTQTLKADPPGGFLFECHCGHIRRVTYSETNFRCERGGVGKDCVCDILWRRLQKDSGEVDQDGRPIFKDDTTEETIEVVDDVTGTKMKMKVPRPQFVGYRVGVLRAQEFAARKARGEAEIANPTNEVIMTHYETSKQQMEKRVAAERQKQKGGELTK